MFCKVRHYFLIKQANVNKILKIYFFQQLLRFFVFLQQLYLTWSKLVF